MNTPEKQNAPGVARSEDAAFAVDLPDHATARRQPREGTARAAILVALRRGQRLTSHDALQAFGTSRLAADIHELRRMGWNVQAETVAVITLHCESHVARYFLAGEVTP